jgi:hypothetical protein
MSGKLVTIATFDQAAKARLAQNTLTEAGIKATVADEMVVTMDWLLGPAVGFIKLQVLDEVSDRAVNVLEGEFGADGEGLGPRSIDDEELAAQAEAARPEGGEERSLPSEPELAASDDREDAARRMVFAAAIGLFFPPLVFYAVYLFLNAAFGEGTLSSRGRFNLWIGGTMMVGGLCFCWLLLFLR